MACLMTGIWVWYSLKLVFNVRIMSSFCIFRNNYIRNEFGLRHQHHYSHILCSY